VSAFHPKLSQAVRRKWDLPDDLLLIP
jgi:HD-like signal output (HDOD) protein